MNVSESPQSLITRSSTMFCLCLVAGLSINTSWADQVLMKNGDRVTGTVIKKDGKHLTIKSDQFGVLSTEWDQVETVKIETPVTVVLQGGKTVQSPVVTRDGKVEVTSNGAAMSVPPAEVTAIRNPDEQRAYERLLKPGWGQSWAGAGTIGLAGTSGNAKTLTLTAGLTAARVTNIDKTSIYFNTIKASALSNGKSADTAQAVRGGLGYDHNLSPRIFVNIFNDWEYDRFQNLDLRLVVGGGLGFHVFKRELSGLDLLAGVDYNHSSFSTPLTRNSAEAYWGDEYAYKLSGTTSLLQSFRMFDDLTSKGTYRVNFDVGASTKLAKWINWNVSLSDRYLNHPAPSRKTNDLLYTTGLGITFAK